MHTFTQALTLPTTNKSDVFRKYIIKQIKEYHVHVKSASVKAGSYINNYTIKKYILEHSHLQDTCNNASQRE